jgi:beta-glucosidase
VKVTNAGKRRGTEVVQAYLGFPTKAGEPPKQLKAFSSTTLSPGHSARVVLHLPHAAFQAYLNNHWMTVSGKYKIFIGTSSSDLPLHKSVTAP